MVLTKKIAYTSLFTAVGVVLNFFSFSLPPFGRASLVYAYCYLVGIFLGPWLGFASASLSDFLPAVIAPQGGSPWMPLITLSTGLMPLFTGLIFKYVPWKNFAAKMILAASVCYVVCTVGVGALGAVPIVDYFPSAKALGASLGITSPFLMLALSKAVTQPVWIVLNVLLATAVYMPLRRYVPAQLNSMST